jgi:hypothetical protein
MKTLLMIQFFVRFLIRNNYYEDIAMSTGGWEIIFSEPWPSARTDSKKQPRLYVRTDYGRP